jgi:hypothetical protein
MASAVSIQLVKVGDFLIFRQIVLNKIQLSLSFIHDLVALVKLLGIIISVLAAPIDHILPQTTQPVPYPVQLKYFALDERSADLKDLIV